MIVEKSIQRGKQIWDMLKDPCFGDVELRLQFMLGNDHRDDR